MSVPAEMLHFCQKATFYVLAVIGFRFAWFCACQCVPLQFIGSKERDFHPKCGFVFSSCDLIFAAGGIFDSTGSTAEEGAQPKFSLAPPAVAPGLGIVVTKGI